MSAETVWTINIACDLCGYKKVLTASSVGVSVSSTSSPSPIDTILLQAGWTGLTTGEWFHSWACLAAYAAARIKK